jgi:hypothetical protein
MYRHFNNAFKNEYEPTEFYLCQNYPNPFREKTVIKYCVAYQTRVLLTVYDSAGKEIEKLVDEDKIPGTYEVEFQSTVGSRQLAINQKAESGMRKAEFSRYWENGEYVYRMKAGDYSCEKKMIVQRKFIKE